MSETTTAVVGAGLAGLTTALSLVEAGCDVVLLEQAAEPGGTTALSSGWIWRYRDMETFAWGAPKGNRDLQQALWDTLPEALIWLDRRGVRRVAGSTSNPRTEGVRIDPPQAIDALVRRLPADTLQCDRKLNGAAWTPDGRVCLQVQRPPRAGDDDPGADMTLEVDHVVFAGGGYAADLDRIASEAGVDLSARSYWAPRHGGGSDGSVLDAALELGARRVSVDGASYARAMPMGVELWPDDYVRFSQVYGEHAHLIGVDGRRYQRAEHDWSDTQLVWDLARRCGSGWYVLDEEALRERTPYGTVEQSVLEARQAGAEVLDIDDGPIATQLFDIGVPLRRDARKAIAEARCAVGIRPGITHTTCGLQVNCSAQVRLERGGFDDRIYAAGVEAGGVATGGYASGLAQALTQGRLAGACVSGLAGPAAGA